MTAIRAELAGSDTCTAEGIKAKGKTPVLNLCRQLLAVGLDPDSALEVYRNGTLALKVRSIGEAAAIEINGEGTGFRRPRESATAPPVRPSRRRVLKARPNGTAPSESHRPMIKGLAEGPRG